MALLRAWDFKVASERERRSHERGPEGKGKVFYALGLGGTRGKSNVNER